MDQSVIHSAKQGSFVPIFKGADVSRYMDISAIDKSTSTAGAVSIPTIPSRRDPVQLKSQDKLASKNQ